MNRFDDKTPTNPIGFKTFKSAVATIGTVVAIAAAVGGGVMWFLQKTSVSREEFTAHEKHEAVTTASFQLTINQFKEALEQNSAALKDATSAIQDVKIEMARSGRGRHER